MELVEGQNRPASFNVHSLSSLSALNLYGAEREVEEERKRFLCFFSQDLVSSEQGSNTTKDVAEKERKRSASSSRWSSLTFLSCERSKRKKKKSFLHESFHLLTSLFLHLVFHHCLFLFSSFAWVGSQNKTKKDAETKKRVKGLEAQKANILAARTVARILRSSLGPKGMDKMLQSPDGELTICTFLYKFELQTR